MEEERGGRERWWWREASTTWREKERREKRDSLSGWLRPVSVALLSATHFLDRSIAKTDRSPQPFSPISTGDGK